MYCVTNWLICSHSSWSAQLSVWSLQGFVLSSRCCFVIGWLGSGCNKQWRLCGAAEILFDSDFNFINIKSSAFRRKINSTSSKRICFSYTESWLTYWINVWSKSLVDLASNFVYKYWACVCIYLKTPWHLLKKHMFFFLCWYISNWNKRFE